MWRFKRQHSSLPGCALVSGTVHKCCPQPMAPQESGVLKTPELIIRRKSSILDRREEFQHVYGFQQSNSLLPAATDTYED